jgi:hypothetical protein
MNSTMSKIERKKKTEEESAAQRLLVEQIQEAIIANNTKLVEDLFAKSGQTLPSYYFSVNEYASTPGVLGCIAYYPIKRNNAAMLKILMQHGVNITGSITFLDDWNSRADKFMSEEEISSYDFALSCGCNAEILGLVSSKS